MTVAPPASEKALLDPGDTSHAIEHSDPPAQMPLEVRAFGFMPTIGILRPGDLLLVSHVGKPLVSQAVRRVQLRAGFEEWQAQWHHSAGYVCNER
jgi:hypothetical protein